MINRKNLQREKKAELTTQQIVILIILIVSFIIILLFIFLLKPGDIAEKEICHNSVVMRSNSLLPADAVPIDCRTKYVCITEDGSCEKMTRPEIVKVKTKEEVYETLAENMVDCWWMFGEGQLDYVGKDWLSKNLYCSICSQIAFDDSVGDSKDLFPNGKIDEGEFYNSYLMIEKRGETGQTYFEYLYNTKDFLQIYSGPFKEMSTDNQYYVMMGIKSNEAGVKWAGVVGAVIVGGAAIIFVPASIPFIAGALVVGGGAGGAGGYFLGGVIKGASGNEFLLPTLIEVNSEVFKSLDKACDEIVTLA